MLFKEKIYEVSLLILIEGNFLLVRFVKFILFYKLDSRICVFFISYKKMVFF